MIVDTSGPVLKVAVQEKAKLIKSNKDEILELMNQKNATDEQMIEYAQTICKQGITYVLISLGKEGAMPVSEHGGWKGEAPEVEVKSTVASMCLSLTEGDDSATMFQKAIALSSTNAMTFETAHVIEQDYQSLLPRCHVKKLNKRNESPIT